MAYISADDYLQQQEDKHLEGKEFELYHCEWCGKEFENEAYLDDATVFVVLKGERIQICKGECLAEFHDESEGS